ncbi:MAG TPA: hypothetical protein VLY83_06645 [Methanoregula sp.]|nr:hypothetical protein [Methanoregula sp.]
MKKLLVVLAILFIGILLAGCTSQPATPAATPTPTEVPTVVATTVPTMVPTAVPTANVTANVTPNATATATPTPVPTVTIAFTQDLTLSPGATVIVPVGTMVVWKNNDALKPHGISSTSFGGMASIPYGQSFSYTFTKVGSYDYTTTFQPQLTGKIVVTSS